MYVKAIVVCCNNYGLLSSSSLILSFYYRDGDIAAQMMYVHSSPEGADLFLLFFFSLRK